MRICFVSDRIGPPYDEGIKNITFNLIRESALLHDVRLLTDSGTGVITNTSQLRLGRFCIGSHIWRELRRQADDLLIYVPFTSLTSASYLRLLALRLQSRASKIAIVGLQSRHFSFCDRLLLRLAAPQAIVVLSQLMQKELVGAGVPVIKFTPGVDVARFKPVPKETRDGLRAQYGLSNNDFVILHVGHLKKSRNLDPVIEAAATVGGRLVVVSSSTFRRETDRELVARLETAGAIILENEIPHIEEIYGMADCYAFPVIERTGATEVPLSVLEAMAVNIPVVTTRYGALPEIFPDDAANGFYYAKSVQEFVSAFERSRKQISVRTASMVNALSWRSTVAGLLRELAPEK